MDEFDKLIVLVLILCCCTLTGMAIYLILDERLDKIEQTLEMDSSRE